MTPEIASYIECHKIYKGSVIELGKMLPEDDALLDEWLTTAIAERNSIHCMFLTLAALAADREVDARHLKRGAVLMQHPGTLASMPLRMKGEVAEAIVEALHETTIVTECQATLILLAAAWCREFAAGVFPHGLIAAARKLARMPLAG